MGSEMPGGQRKKRKVPWNDDRGTNKIYASGEISALGNNKTVSDSTLKPGQEPPIGGVTTPTQKADDKSADKYYANGGSSRKKPTAAGLKKQKIDNKLGKAPTLAGPKNPPHRVDPNAPLLITTKEHINGVLGSAIEKAKAGEKVTVFITKGDSQLLKRTRANLDLLVTREVLTEDEYREIRIAYEVDGTEVAAPPPVVETQKVVADFAGDPLAFLNGDDEESADEVIDTSPLTQTTVVDTTADVKDAETAAIEEEVKEESGPAVLQTATEDDEGDGFLAPAKDTKVETPVLNDTVETAVLPDTNGFREITEIPQPPVTDNPASETQVDTEPEAVPPAPEEKRKGKRHGRGS
jgi:hypothetical protein